MHAKVRYTYIDTMYKSLSSWQKIIFPHFMENRGSCRQCPHVLYLQWCINYTNRPLSESWIQHCDPCLAL